jgi:hypothetical protein
MYDPSAVRYSCQVREIIREVTNETKFLRRGDFWYRNPEFGKKFDETDQLQWGGSFHPVVNPYKYARYQLDGGKTENEFLL